MKRYEDGGAVTGRMFAKRNADSAKKMRQKTYDRMLDREKELENANTFELDFMGGRKGKPSDYGTSLGGGAVAAEKAASDSAWKQGKSLREMEPDVRKAMREAAAEERREAARSLKKGGSVRSSASKRADGIAQRGKTRGRVI